MALCDSRERKLGGKKMISQFFVTIIFWIIGLYVLYRVIYAAVKNGVDNSVLGRTLVKTQKTKFKRKPLHKDSFEN